MRSVRIVIAENHDGVDLYTTTKFIPMGELESSVVPDQVLLNYYNDATEEMDDYEEKLNESR